MKQHFLFLLSVTALLASPQVGFGQAPPALGAAASFALFTAAGAVNNSGPSVITGDIGTNAGAFSGFPPGVLNGTIHVADAYSTQAATDVETAYGYFSSHIPCVTPLALYGGTPAVTLAPGSYCVGGASTLAGTLILDGGGDPNATFYLRVTGALTTGENSRVLVQNGASVGNVYWQIGGQTTLGQNSVMRGTLLVDGAINMIEGATLLGHGLSRAGAITIDTNTATVPGTTAAQTALASTAALAAAEVTLYPNPAHSSFTVRVPAMAGTLQLHAELLNGLGQVVRRHEAGLNITGASFAMETTGLAAGIYSLRLQAGKATLAKRVVIR